MAHLIIEEDFKSVIEYLKYCKNCFFAEDEILVLISREELNIPLTIRPHGDKTTIVRVDNFPMFVDETLIENALKEFAEKAGLKVQYENFSKKQRSEDC